MAEVEHAASIRPMPGNSVGGDAAVILEIGEVLWAVVIDVLGHGPDAYELALRVVDQVQRVHPVGPGALLEELHREFLGSRGFGAAVVSVDKRDGRVCHAGVGNVVARTLCGGERRFVSSDGVVGLRFRTPKEETVQLPHDGLVVMYTDGVSNRFGLAEYPMICSHEASEVVDTIVALFGKDHDDAGCIALRYKATAAS